MTLGRIMSVGQSAITEPPMSDRMQYHGQTGGGYVDPYQTHQYQYQPQPNHGQGQATLVGGYGGMPVHQYPTHKGGHSYSKHHHSSGGHGKKGAALSALTLLAFMFFLNILQNCLRDQMNAMNPEVTVMTAQKKTIEELQKEAETQNTRPSNDRFRNNRETVYSIFKIDRVPKPQISQQRNIKEDDDVYRGLIIEDNEKIRAKMSQLKIT